MTMLELVRDRVAKYPGTMGELARETGVTHSWLRMFRQGNIPNPGYDKVQALADYFTGKPAPRQKRGRTRGA